MVYKIRVFNDYSVRWPLWGDDGMLEPDALDISAQLRVRIEEWAAEFNEMYDFLRGWPSVEVRELHRAEGVEIANCLREELGQAYEVKLEYWENDARD
ncbi:MAG: hypothetical protein ACREQ3_26280 [Candidatus Binatia bacterium]